MYNDILAVTTTAMTARLEAPRAAFEDVGPVLGWLAGSLGKPPAALSWDLLGSHGSPELERSGSARAHLASAGFPAAAGAAGACDVLLACIPPAHSAARDMEQLLRALVASGKPGPRRGAAIRRSAAHHQPARAVYASRRSAPVTLRRRRRRRRRPGKPWALLAPNYLYTAPFYRPVLDGTAPPGQVRPPAPIAAKLVCPLCCCSWCSSRPKEMTCRHSGSGMHHLFGAATQREDLQA